MGTEHSGVSALFPSLHLVKVVVGFSGIGKIYDTMKQKVCVPRVDVGIRYYSSGGKR